MGIAAAGRIRVLHVDDDPEFADLTATFLERTDERFAVTTATSADAGLDRLADGTFDCVVSDYDMPGQNGIEFLRAVRDHDVDLPRTRRSRSGEATREAVRHRPSSTSARASS